MRQTLLVERMIANSRIETLVADNYLHFHIVPTQNKSLSNKCYSVSGNQMEDTWRSVLNDQSRYILVDPKHFMKPIQGINEELWLYLKKRYWG